MKLVLGKSYLFLEEGTRREQDIANKVLGARRSALGLRLPKTRASFCRVCSTFPNIEYGSDLSEYFGSEFGFPRDETFNISLRRWNHLLPHQVRGVEFLTTSVHKGGLLNFLPGLGKSATAIVASDILKAQSVLVISPKTVIPTWEREIRKWSIGPSKYTIANLELVYHRLSEYLLSWDILIIDESIKVKNRSSKMAKRLLEISKISGRVFLLSGIPTTVDITDLWHQFKMVDASLFPSYWRFAEQYAHVVQMPWAREIHGSRQDIDFVDEFNDLRYIVEDDVIDIPPMRKEVIDLRLSGVQKTMYDQMEQDFEVLLDGDEVLDAPIVLTQLNYLQQILSNTRNVDPSTDYSVKADELEDLISDEKIEFPLLIWGQWIEGLQSLRDQLCIYLNIEFMHGGTPPGERDAMLQRYLSGKTHALILTYGVGKYGLTLTNTRTVVYFDKTFNFDNFGQSVYRTERIGSKISTKVISLNVPGTVDEILGDNILTKADLHSRLTRTNLKIFLDTLGR